MKRKYRKKGPYTQVLFRLPDQCVEARPFLDEANHFICWTLYPNKEVFEWLDENIPDYCFMDYPDRCEVLAKNEQQFIMARLMFGAIKVPHPIKFRPRKRTHRLYVPPNT